MAASNQNEAPTSAATPEPVKAEAKASDKLSEWTTSSRIEQPPQHIDEYDYETAMRLMKSHLQFSDEIRKGGAGRWVVPSQYEHMTRIIDKRPAWRFTRLGTLTDARRRDTIAFKKQLLVMQGWKPAPPGTRNTLFLTDGEHGVYMCIPEPVARLKDDEERKTRMEIRKRRFSRTVNRLPEDLQRFGGRGMEIEQVDVSQGTTSVSDFMKR